MGHSRHRGALRWLCLLVLVCLTRAFTIRPNVGSVARAPTKCSKPWCRGTAPGNHLSNRGVDTSEVWQTLVQGRRGLMRRFSDAATLAVDAPPPEESPQLPAEVYMPRMGPLGRVIRAGKFTFTPIGVVIFVMVFGTAFLFYPPLMLATLISSLYDNKRRRLVDWVIYWWSFVTTRAFGYAPKVVGMENLPPKNETVMYIPNHTSYLDILTLSGAIKRPFKYISKVEVLRIPLIGWAMWFAKHIAIKRTSQASQLQTLQQAVAHLKDGNSLVTFAEGTRSRDGRLLPFKKGPFRMAKQAGVRIVPISICHLFKWMPNRALAPYGAPSDVIIRIHPIVETAGKNENAAMKEVYAAVNAGLPEYQQAPPKRITG